MNDAFPGQVLERRERRLVVGEHELRAWSRQPGRAWVKGGVWTLPADATVRVGLVSHGGAGATAEFDYFRLYR